MCADVSLLWGGLCSASTVAHILLYTDDIAYIYIYSSIYFIYLSKRVKKLQAPSSTTRKNYCRPTSVVHYSQHINHRRRKKTFYSTTQYLGHEYTHNNHTRTVSIACLDTTIYCIFLSANTRKLSYTQDMNNREKIHSSLFHLFKKHASKKLPNHTRI